VSLSPSGDLDGGAPAVGPGAGGPLDRLGELADRLGVGVPTLVGATIALCLAAYLGYRAFTATDVPPVELEIPYASVTTLAVPAGGSGADPMPTTAPADATALTVHAAGAVRHPGLYVLASGARVADLLAAAGGPLPEADLDRVNLASPIADGARVYVPAVGQDAPPPVVAGDLAPAAGGGGGGDPGATIDLNLADAAALETLPGIGPATAAAIVQHRERNGPFRTVDDLLAVRGIGEAKLAAVRDLVSVG
jgi:competence protein ComEA